MNFQTEIETLIDARYPILYVITSEEMRVQSSSWRLPPGGRRRSSSGPTAQAWCRRALPSSRRRAATRPPRPLAALDLVIDQVEPAIFLFKDFHPFLTRSNFAVIRRLKDIALHLKHSRKNIVLVSPVMEIPAELDKEIR